MNVLLKRDDLLRLRQSAGTLVDVVAGRVWISEEAGDTDFILDAGQRHCILGSGLILVGAERDRHGQVVARIVLQSLLRLHRFEAGVLRAVSPGYLRWLRLPRALAAGIRLAP